ncbi:MAG: methyl-accepting chemotaxis protein [Peptostreptococcaceae bacterium]|nr:methyl-accepting chemotaxis protein [Peptostreptococcaceae bacterium]
MKSIRTKLMLVMSIVIIIPMLILGNRSYVKSRTILQKQLEENIYSKNQTSNYIVKSYFDSASKIVKTSSKNETYIAGIASYDDEQIISALKNLKENCDYLENVFLGTKDGNMYMYPKENLKENYDPRNRIWYQGALKTNDIIWSKPYISSSKSELIISPSIKIKDKRGNIIGVLSGSIKLKDLSDRLNSLIEKENISLSIISKDNKYIVSKDINNINKELVDVDLKQVKQIYNENELIKTNYNGQNIIAMYKNIEKLDWTIITAINENIIYNDIKEILINNIIITLIGIILALSASFIYSTRMTKRIKELVRVMNQIKNGNLTAKVDIQTEDEIGMLSNAFNIMVENIKNLIESANNVNMKLNKSANILYEISKLSSENLDMISTTIDDISQGTIGQAKDCEEAVIKSETLSNNFEDLIDTSRMMFIKANDVKSKNSSGVEIVNNLQEKNLKTNDSNRKINKAVLNLDSKTVEIESILATIRTIAEQTNLLALNASIEAARAGEAGKGFAVVAGEIRKLAENTSNSTVNIKDIIEQIRIESQNTVDIVNEVEEIMLEQNESVKEATKIFDEIKESVNNMNTEISQMNNVILNVKDDKDDITSAIESISCVSQESAASIEQTTKTISQQLESAKEVYHNAADLKAISDELDSEINKFIY